MMASNHLILYNAAWSSFGGGEKYALMISEILSFGTEYGVSLLIPDETISKERLSQYFNINLDRVKVLRARTRSEILHSLSEAEVSIILSNFLPFGHPAKRTVYIVQIPYGDISFGAVMVKIAHRQFREALKDILRKRLLSDVRRSNCTLVYSQFVKDTLDRCHGIKADVLYPPIDDFRMAEANEKAPIILSVGRFFRGPYNDKRFDILIEAFKKFCEQGGSRAWEYHLLGSCTQERRSQDYLTELRQVASGYPIFFHPNAPYATLKEMYNRASIFWHGAGFGVNEDLEPERTEHFGMTTVEAMSAECVPVVINKGGQKEIVSHGESGYLWNTIDELVSHTMRLIEEPSLLREHQQNARRRFKNFDREHFARRLQSIIQTQGQ